MTSGTARPRACGQEITSTVTRRSTANAGSPRTVIHATNVAAPATMAAMVSQNAARSAKACAREREDCACSTRRMMPARAVCSPVPVTRTRSDPAPFTVPAITRSPGAFFTGRDSPVIMDSLTSLAPSSTTPSAGILAPGRTSTRSPISSAPIGSSSTSSARARGVRCSGGAWPAHGAAPWAWEIDRISIQWPRSMIVTRVASSSHSGMPG